MSPGAHKLKIISSSGVALEADFVDENPLTSESVWNELPIEAYVSLWGDEIYFSTPVQMSLEKSKSVVEVGDVAYWPPGKAICIFFGPTPNSRGNEIRPASPVNVFAQIKSNIGNLKRVKNGEKIRLERMV
jgi:hypothetical protein